MKTSLVRTLRESLGLSGVQFAASLNVSLPLLRKVERGELKASPLLKKRLLEVYGVDISRRELRTKVGTQFTPEFFESRRRILEDPLTQKNILEGLKNDVELLVRAAGNTGVLHSLAPRLHECLFLAAKDLQLFPQIESVRQAANTVSAGEIRAYERTSALRQRRRRLLDKLDRLEQSSGRKHVKESVATRAKIADLDKRIREGMERINVRGRRKTIYRSFNKQVVIISPRVPNNTMYENPLYPEFGVWWPLTRSI